ncbi:unnamed protein product [Heligmosomoides polygyrus]|uniref:sarcosine oxidasee (formaldehyde-forming) n=1 Tax=Heligmosomoides polygyrus TaxID=6339 RepID=A0A3P7YRK7_HELPZ|nr:unnamed protein product [Heligmosomoides polygyrus]
MNGSCGFDVIVVGAGIFGSCTAYHCQKRGLKTLLLEQYELGHHNGSSHGLSRIIRYAHTDSPYVPLVNETYRQIEELEKKTGDLLWRKTGLLWASSCSEIASISSILQGHHVNHEVIKGTEIANRYPQFVFDDDWSGVLYANKWLQTFQKEFMELGGQIHDNEEVLEYCESSGDVSVKSAKKEYTGKKVIFTVGPWIQKVFPKLPLNVQPLSVAVCYWKSKRDEDSPMLDMGKFPVFISSRDSLNQFNAFALPAIDYPGSIKVRKTFGADTLSKKLSTCHNDFQESIDIPANYIKQHLPNVDGSHPSHLDKCKYTVSEDEHYVIGPFPGSKNVLVGGCGSGSGFKVAPAIGKVLSEMAAGQTPSVDVSFFSFDRFLSK